MSNVAVRAETPSEVIAHAHDHDAHGHEGGHGHHGPANLLHHFTDLKQQRESNLLGMWVFLITEVMTFGALFFVYTLYRHMFDVQAYQAGFKSPFAIGSELLDNGLGFINTLVLLASSLTVATAVHAASMKNKKQLLNMMYLTWVLGFAFLGIKSVEWYNDYREGIVPGLNWNPETTLSHYGYVLANPTGTNGEAYLGDGSKESLKEFGERRLAEIHAAAATHGGEHGAAPAAEHSEGGHGEGGHAAFHGVVNGMHMQMFYVIYFCMAGLHAIHMVIGLGILAFFIRHARNDIFTASSNAQPVEIFGLYWHFVDIIWVFLYPLLYLIAH
jgi:cytochrome c oxidase subunit 3